MVHYRKWCQAPQRDLPRDGWEEVRPMDSTFTIDLKGIERPSPRTSDASALRELTQQVNRATLKVERYWGELPVEERDAYLHFAYAVTEFRNEEPHRLRSLFERSIAGFNLFLITLKGEQEAFVEYAVAMQRFVEAVLDAIEHENDAYQEAVTETLQEEELPGGAEEAMTLEEARERRRQLRYQVLK